MKLLRWLLGIVLCAWAGQYLLAMLLPGLVMEMLYHLGGQRTGINQLVVAPVPDASFRDVVRPSPDLLYASCIYDLRAGPLVVEAQVPPRYWSMQFYQMNTDNYAGITNQRGERSRAGSRVRIILTGPDQDPAGYPGEIIRSPTRRGIILLRASAIGDRSEQRRALENSRCGPLHSDVRPPGPDGQPAAQG